MLQGHVEPDGGRNTWDSQASVEAGLLAEGGRTEPR